MSLSNVRVNFDAGASLLLLQPGIGYVRGDTAHGGTLRSAVKCYLLLQPDDYGNAEIAVDHGTVEGDITLINEPGIKELAQHPDF